MFMYFIATWQHFDHNMLTPTPTHCLCHTYQTFHTKVDDGRNTCHHPIALDLNSCSWHNLDYHHYLG